MNGSLGTIKALFVSGAAKSALVAGTVVAIQVAVITTVKLQSVHPRIVAGQESPVAGTLQTEVLGGPIASPALVPTDTSPNGSVTAVPPPVTGEAMAGQSAEPGVTAAAPQTEPTPIDTVLETMLIPERFGDRTPYIP